MQSNRSETTTTEEQQYIRLVGSPEREIAETTQQGAEINNTRDRPQVTWTEDTIDNEHMNKQKSKICCIFHPKTEFGESEEEESLSESSSSESDSDSDSDSSCNHCHRPSRPNAYERPSRHKRVKPVH
ncbi:hypothetical protein DASB73_034670 [Starmerella bacillaris]|uniref:Type 1 phosphatases regulator n=1 Tax=Starmerella bacillaris TaxID=1247836 RepID=A0AAV5RPP4_STABA|nr:hypothetical protein DASB73_034670 [Starmerella bacillaris]